MRLQLPRTIIVVYLLLLAGINNNNQQLILVYSLWRGLGHEIPYLVLLVGLKYHVCNYITLSFHESCSLSIIELL